MLQTGSMTTASLTWQFKAKQAATDIAFARYTVMPTPKPPPTLHPMTDFDPSEPAILHDRISDTIIAWSVEEADAFRRSCVQREDGALAWNGYEFDGWGNVLGG
jgi:hypothetical protein